MKAFVDELLSEGSQHRYNYPLAYHVPQSYSFGRPDSQGGVTVHVNYEIFADEQAYLGGGSSVGRLNRTFSIQDESLKIEQSGFFDISIELTSAEVAP